MTVQRGEVIRVNLNPTEGREQTGQARPCLVVSSSRYNLVRKGIALIMPITSTVKPEIKVMIPLPEGLQIQGSVMAEQIRTVDLSARWWQTTNVILPKPWVDLVVDTLNIIIH